VEFRPDRAPGLPMKPPAFAVALVCHALFQELAAAIHCHINWQGIEELVREDHPLESFGQLAGVELHRRIAPLPERRSHLAPARAKLHHAEAWRLAHLAIELAHT